MTQDEIIDMAEQAGFDCYGKHITWDDVICTDEIKAFAKVVAAKEREAIIQIIKAMPFSNWFLQFDVIEAIRARGQGTPERGQA